jgi:hypothetical protein
VAEEIGALRAVLALESAAFARGAQAARRELGALDGSLQRTGGNVVQFGRRMSTDATAGFNALGAGAARTRGQLQNFGFQVQDVAVQIAAGTSAAVALGQQLPQLLSGFGTVGIVVGTLAAVTLPLLAYAFSSTGEEVKKTKEEIDRLLEATRGFQVTAQSIRLGVDEAEVADVMALNKALKERAEIERQLYERPTGDALADLKAEYSINTETVRVLTEKIGAYRSARDEATGLIAAQERLKATAEAFTQSLADTQTVMTQIAGLDISGPFFAAQGAAAGLLETVLGVVNAAASLPGTVAAGDTQFQQKLAGAYGLYGFTRSQNMQPEVRRSGGGGGTSAAQKEANELQREAARVIEQTRTESEKYSAEVAKLDTLLKSGAITQDTYNRAIEDLKGSLSTAADYAGALESSFESAFTSFVTGASTAREAASQLLGELAQLFAQSAFRGLFAGSNFFSNLGGFLANADGNVFSGGRVQAFANGGIVNGPTLFPMANGTGLMGEAGPEAVMPLTRVGGKLGVRAVGGGGGVTISIDARGAVEGTAELIERKIRDAIPEITRRGVATSIAAGKRGYAA